MKLLTLKPLCVALCLSFLPVSMVFAEKLAPEKIKFTVKKFTVEGESLAQILDADDIENYLKPFQEKSFNLKELQDVGKGLEAMIRKEGFAFYRVILPPQSLNSGAVTLKVIAFDIGNIKVEGNQHFTEKNVLASLPELKKDISPNTHDLSQSAKIANRHPSKQVVVTFKQTENEDKIDAMVNVTEQPRPYQFSLALNNTGTQSSGDFRLAAAAQYSNLWGRDHIVSASYTLPPEHADTVKQYGGTYALPIYPLNAWLNMYYAYSSANNGVVSGMSITGAGEMMGIHYQQFLPKFEKYEHSLDIGFDSRYFLSSVELKGTKLPGDGNVRSLPFSAMYKADYAFEHLQTGYFLQWAMNTGWGSENADNFYDKSRKGADSSWQIFRYGSNFATAFENWLLTTSLTGQYSEKPLIAGEQLGIGGTYDVRGYEQRETGADNGQIVKVELTTPAWKKMNAFVFYDYGHGTKEKTLPGEVKDWNLSGTGIGAKWQWQEYVNTSLTFATALNDSNTTKAFNNRILFNVNFRY
jgi:hemolysin activation/secretion protein